MSEMIGKYQHEKNENLDQYFRDTGVPYIPRKLMLASKPQMEISTNEEGKWTITTTSLIRTVTLEFKLNEEYEEHMPGGVVLKSTTRKEDDKLRTVSIAPNGSKSTRTYEFTDTHCIVALKHEPTGTEGRRYYKRF